MARWVIGEGPFERDDADPCNIICVGDGRIPSVVAGRTEPQSLVETGVPERPNGL
jgi:hypothetical protein